MNNFKSKFLIIFMIFPYLNIHFFMNGSLNEIIYFWTIVSFFASIIVFLKMNKKLDSLDILLACYFTFTILISFIRGTLSFGVFYSIISLYGIILFLKFCLKANVFATMYSLYWLYVSVAIVNFLSMLMHSSSLENDFYFLGGKNVIQMTILPTIFIIFIYSYLVKKKLTKLNLTLIIICLISMQLSKSGTALVITLLIIIFFFIYKKNIISFGHYLFVYTVLFFSIVIFRIQEKAFNSFISGYLDKEVTFTGRTYLWDIALNKIRDSWLVGYGRGNSVISSNSYMLSNHLNEVHNGVLELLLSIGFFGLALFVLILLLVKNQLNRYKKHIFSTLLSFSIFLYMTVGLSESIFNRFEFWLLLTLAYSIESLVNATDSKLNSDRRIRFRC
ncbi:O-antigen ligase family protein [Priestia megaterium]|uniref:O-antigen ligase family protein n=1 Tax=Priestia megaterium TaxID=1404 RepID=UPI0020793062|nr:O-antigen ligase family protein [Priestia megaterium]USL25725.1 O-antigen ligase family protein [Priestia megaterium]